MFAISISDCSWLASGPRGLHDAPRATDRFTLNPQRPRRQSKNRRLLHSGGAASSDLKGYAKRLSLSLDGQPEQFDYIFLRDACGCPRCIDLSTRQKSFQTSDIPANITAHILSQAPDGSVQIRWTNDIPGFDGSHTTSLSQAFLRTYSAPRNVVRSRYNEPRQVLWDRATITADAVSLGFKDYMSSDEAVLEALRQLNTYGLVFLHDVPASPSSVADIGERIGPLRHSFYGRTWDVRSVASAKNVAYTSQNIGFHMDLLYMANPPTLQLLHCIHNKAEGGESLFADSFRAAAHVRLASPMLAQTLQSFPVTYHYVNDAQHYHHTHPTLVMEHLPGHSKPRLSAVNYSPPFQAPFESDTGSADQGSKLRQYLAAIKAFARHVEAPEAIYERKLAEGECVVFHNRRVLHARRAFAPGTGERWLRGAYLDGDVFASRWRVLSEQLRSGPDQGMSLGGDEHI
ncbi:MAG: hypothetical protein M1832_002074 [Thelocarpon impressellum]|nr:MAG: hypothetical protein M1832_002074 [Thelocarpon impressellum]